ncbi:MAG: hypothetical protein NVS9B14_06310 [Candidatus Acidiferrum sp.]
MSEQNYRNHVKWTPLFHFVSLPILVFYFVWMCVRMWKTHFSIESVEYVIVAVGLLAGLFSSRLAALKVQDRVIRLEERQRMARLLPEDLRPRIEEFRTGQLVALRFASDSELPALARKVLDEKITEGKQIKLLVKNWRGDYLRA